MKSSLKVCATLAAFAILTVGGALSPAAAAGGFVIGTAPGTTEADCTNGGGTVSVDAAGRKICVPPRPVKSSAPVGREPTN